MAKILLRAGFLLTVIAVTIIATGFVVFAFFAALLIAPGLILYNAGIRSIMNNGYNGDAKMIDVTPETGSGIGGKGKAIAKSAIRKIRDFLNKYAD